MSSNGSDLFPEKFAMYFSTMNPLASKIYAEVEGVEDYVKSHGPASINYNEKCTIVDKFLIYDHLNKNNANGKLNKKLTHFQKYQFNKSETSLNSILDNDKEHAVIGETELLQPVFYNDTALDQDHETGLLTSVAPKKPEKYVYDDSNNYWIDEHSVSYSSCTETQAKACKLQQFLDSLPPPTQTAKRHDHPHKYRAPPIPTLIKHEDESSSYIVKQANKKSSFGSDEEDDDIDDRYSRIDKKDSDKNLKNKPSTSIRVPLFGGMFGEEVPETSSKSNNKDELADCSQEGNNQDLPNQVQNKDLIAELQAKLKKGSKREGFKDGISPRSSTKINKPKAPPPPAPVKLPGSAVKLSSATQSSSKAVEMESKSSLKKMDREISDEFVVDVSSPCKIATPKTGLDFLDNW